ncbi:MAG: ribose-5-phosphate isomerase A, partial [Parvularculaceae bacterium]
SVARAARRGVVVADETKRGRALGAFALPIEIVRAHYGLTARAVRDALRDHGLPSDKVSLRTGDGRGEGPFLTDNGGYVLDCALGRIDAPADLDAALRRLPGVVETGLFLGLADEAFVANAGGVARLGRG